MKHIVLLIALLLGLGTISAQTQTKKVDNKTYQAVKASKATSYVATDMKYIETDGQTYTIYEHTFTKGARKGQVGYFIKKTSKKSGKSYWKEVKLN
jgi:hypothetical protein